MSNRYKKARNYLIDCMSDLLLNENEIEPYIKSLDDLDIEYHDACKYMERSSKPPGKALFQLVKSAVESGGITDKAVDFVRKFAQIRASNFDYDEQEFVDFALQMLSNSVTASMAVVASNGYAPMRFRMMMEIDDAYRASRGLRPRSRK